GLAETFAQVVHEERAGLDVVGVGHPVDLHVDAIHGSAPWEEDKVLSILARRMKGDKGHTGQVLVAQRWTPWWIGPASSPSRSPLPPQRSAMISAATLTAVSSGVRAPRSRPMGEESRLISSSVRPASRSRSSRSSCVRRDPIAPT